MGEWNFLQWRVGPAGSVAIIALTLMALGLMLGIVKIADVFKYLGASLGIMIVLMLLLGAIVND